MSGKARRLLAGGHLVVDGPATADLARRLLDGNLADPVVDDTEVSIDDLTVVVPVRDRLEQLARCLASLRPLRVVVVDDASKDPGGVARVAEKHGASVVHLSQNVGPAGARNAGLARVRTPYVAFVDSDVVVAAATLLELTRHCTDPTSHSLAHACAGSCVIPGRGGSSGTLPPPPSPSARPAVLSAPEPR